jgi:hypothetical protein
MTQDEIIEMYLEVSNKLCNGKEWCWAGVGEPLQLFAKLVAQHERERIFGELIKMHEIASSRHNYYLNAVLTIRARGQA